MEVMNISFMRQNNVLNAFLVIYLPIIHASMEESSNIIDRNDTLNSLLATVGQLFRAFYDLIALTATCGQSNIP